MRKIQKMCAALLAGVMTVGTFAPSVFADEAAKELTDEQVINVRTTAFGNNYDVQDMGLEMDDGRLATRIITVM